ncbi:MAG: hypothetical protein GX940_09640 [Clostridiaceae bacterium]|jgi:hypothetical protein|nr:hypothetical protein [Clostridiaceae bacterium]
MTKVMINAVKKYPSLVITPGVVFLIAAVFNRLVPVMAMIIGVVNMTGGDFFDSVLAILQMMTDLQNIPLILIVVAALAILLSVLTGLILPGYLLAASDALEKGTRKKGLILEGIKKYFLRFFLMTIAVVISAVVLLLFLLVAIVPAIVMTRVAFSSSPELLVAAIFIDIMTIGVVFAGLSFFSVYTYMWYIASLTKVKKPFKLGKEIADCRFWNIVLGLFIFDVIFAVGFFIIYMAGIQIIRYAAGWIFATAFFTALALYLVKFFKDNLSEGTFLKKVN